MLRAFPMPHPQVCGASRSALVTTGRSDRYLGAPFAIHWVIAAMYSSGMQLPSAEVHMYGIRGVLPQGPVRIFRSALCAGLHGVTSLRLPQAVETYEVRFA